MNKTFVLSCFFVFLCLKAVAAEAITGFWKTVDSKTKKPQSIIAIYEYQGKYYGRLIGSYDDDGVMRDTIYSPQGRAPGVVGNPYYCGMDILWNLKDDDDDGTYQGKIIDPREGDVYSAEVWVKGVNLIVRGEVFIFGKNITWPPATAADFPKGFKKPNVKKFVPVIPQVY